MNAKEKLYWTDLAMMAFDSKKDLVKAIKRSESRLHDTYGWKAVLTFRIFTIIKLFWVISKFKEKTSSVFTDVEVHISKSNIPALKKVVGDYNNLLITYRSDIIKLFALVDAGSTADPETRFSAYTYGGHIG